MELQGQAAKEIQHRFEEDLEAKLWKDASKAYNGKGLENGKPNFGPASKAHAQMIKNGDFDKAKAIELIVSNKIWSK